MIRLVLVGPNRSTKGGHSSKGYTISRRGRNVHLCWGPIDCFGTRGGRYYWAPGGPITQTKEFQTTDEAISFATRQQRDKISRGYRKLGWLQRIHPPTR